MSAVTYGARRNHSGERQLITGIADVHQLVLVTNATGIVAVIVMPGHPYYDVMLPRVERIGAINPSWEVRWQDFWAKGRSRTFAHLGEANLYSEMLLRPYRLEEVSVWKQGSLTLDDIIAADRIWRGKLENRS